MCVQGEKSEVPLVSLVPSHHRDIYHMPTWTEPKAREPSNILKCPNLERSPALVHKEKIKLIMAPLMLGEQRSSNSGGTWLMQSPAK